MSENTISTADVELKKSVAAAVAGKSWNYFGIRPNPDEAANFANVGTPQGAGEAIFSVREDGRTDLFLFL